MNKLLWRSVSSLEVGSEEICELSCAPLNNVSDGNGGSEVGRTSFGLVTTIAGLKIVCKCSAELRGSIEFQIWQCYSFEHCSCFSIAATAELLEKTVGNTLQLKMVVSVANLGFT